jgi:hypothetical protein
VDSFSKKFVDIVVEISYYGLGEIGFLDLRDLLGAGGNWEIYQLMNLGILYSVDFLSKTFRLKKQIGIAITSLIPPQ